MEERSLGEHIAALRAKSGLSQEDLAGLLAVSRQSVSKWETDASVPDLDKLVKLSESFGVSLDELVKGETLRRPAAEAPAQVPDPAPAPGWNGQKVAGTVLLSLYGAAAVLLLCFGGLVGALSGMLLTSPLLLCGIICLAVKKRAGLWCVWAVWLCAETFLRFGTGLSWSTIFLTLQWTEQMNYYRLATAWAMAIVPVILIGCTCWSFREAKCPGGGRSWPCLAAWGAVIAVRPVTGAVSRALLERSPGSNGQIDYGAATALQLVGLAGDWLMAAALCVALIWTLALLRERRKSKSVQ